MKKYQVLNLKNIRKRVVTLLQSLLNLEFKAAPSIFHKLEFESPCQKCLFTTVPEHMMQQPLKHTHTCAHHDLYFCSTN